MKITDIRNKKIKRLFGELIYDSDYSYIEIERDFVNDTVSIIFNNTYEAENGKTYEDCGRLTLSKDGVSEYPLNEEQQYLYKQWLIANGIHPLFEENPFIKKETQNEKIGYI